MLQGQDTERGLGRRGVRRADRVVVGLAGAGRRPPRAAAAAARCGSTYLVPRHAAAELAPDDLQRRGRLVDLVVLDLARRALERTLGATDAHLHERGIDELDDVAAGRRPWPWPAPSRRPRPARPPPGSPRRRVGRWLSGSALGDSFVGEERLRRAKLGHASPGEGTPRNPGFFAATADQRERRSGERESRLAPAPPGREHRCDVQLLPRPPRRARPRPGRHGLHGILRVRLGPVVGEGAGGAALPADARRRPPSSPRR